MHKRAYRKNKLGPTRVLQTRTTIQTRHELQTRACLCSDPFTTLSLLHSVLYLNTTFPRLPCQLVVIEFQPMGEAGKRLEGGRKGEARVFLRLFYLKGACPPVAYFLHGPKSHLAVCLGSWQVDWLLAPVTLPPRFSLQRGDSSGPAVARFWLPHSTCFVFQRFAWLCVWSPILNSIC